MERGGATLRRSARRPPRRGGAPGEGTFGTLVTATPPYLVPGCAVVPLRRQQAGCHIELRGGIEEYCEAARRWLAPRGRFVVCHSDVERAELAFERSGLAVEERVDVIPRAGKVLLFSVFHARERSDGDSWPANGTSHRAIIVRDRDGRWTEDFRALRREMAMPA